MGDNSGAVTVTAGDEIDGGAGTDTFNYFGAAAAVVVPQLSGVEVLNLNDPAVTTALDLSEVTDLTNVNYVDDAIGDNSLAGIAVASDVTFGLNNVTQTGNNTITVDFGSATTANLALSNAQVRTLNADGTDVTTVAIESNGDAANTLRALASTGTEDTVSITGPQDLTITDALNASVAEIDGSEATGAVAVEIATDVSGATGSLTFTGGAGDDTLNTGARLNNTNVNADATIALDGGDGTDILAVDAQIDSDVTVDGTADITNFEILQLEADAVYDLDGYDWVEQVNINANITGAKVIDNIAAGVTTNLLVNTASLSLSHEDEGAAGTQTQLINIGGDAGVTATLLDNDGVENITVTSTGDAANTITEMTAEGLRELTVAGDQDLTIGSITTIADSIDASGSAGTVDINLTGNDQGSALEVTAGAGGLTLFVDAADENAHAITLGAGDDKIKIDDADVAANVSASLADQMSITGFSGGDAGGDQIEFFTDTTSGEAHGQVATTAELADIQTAVDGLAAGSTVNNAFDAAIGAFTAVADDVYFFEFDGNTYVGYEDGTDATTFDLDEDYSIELIGTDLGLVAADFEFTAT